MSRPDYEPDVSSSTPSIYSTYICREPVGDVAFVINNGPDEYTSLLRTLQRSADHWAEKDHNRTVERLQLEIAHLHMQNKQWRRAMRTLVPLWQTLTWRQAGWWNMLEEVDWALKECAMNVRDAETLVAVEWELMNQSLTRRQDGRADFREALKDLEGTQARPMPVVRSENILSCVSALFAFGEPEGNVGVPLASQLILYSRAHADSTQIDLSQIKITFKGGLRNISIHHNPGSSNDQVLSSGLTQIHEIFLQTSPSDGSLKSESPALGLSHNLLASADLSLRPGQTTVLALTSVPREAGQVEVSNIIAYVKAEEFDLELIHSENKQLRTDSFWVSSAAGVIQKPLKAERSTAVRILPKPPKIRIGLPNLLDTYYVDESIILDLEITNEEEESAKGSIDVRLNGPPGMYAKFAWRSEPKLNDPLEGTTSESTSEDRHQRLLTKDIGVIAPGTHQKYEILIKSTGEAVEYSLQIEAHYCLLSDPETPISKIFTTDLVFMKPFEAASSFAPRLHPDTWPNYFDIEDINTGKQNEQGHSPSGLIQRWALISRLRSLATDTLIVEDISPKLQHISPPETATCKISPSGSSETATSGTSSQNSSKIVPSTVQSYPHVLDIQKIDLDDRHSLAIKLSLQIRYHRLDGATSSSTATASPTITSTTTTLPISPLTIPFGEPRCLASLGFSKCPTNSATAPHIIPLIYTIENPSSYTLTFAITMDNNEAFAFSGPKSLSIQLLPLTRRSIEYQLLPVIETRKGLRKGEDERGCWIWPHCVVVDTGFSKTLRVLPAAEGLKGGKRGEIGVWINEEV